MVASHGDCVGTLCRKAAQLYCSLLCKHTEPHDPCNSCKIINRDLITWAHRAA